MRTHHHLAAALTLALAALAPEAALASPCPVLPETEQGEKHCARSAHGIAIAATPERAERLLALGEAARARFGTLFARSASRYAIVEMGTSGFSGAARAALRQAGYSVVLPWLSPQAYRDQAVASVRRGLEGRLAGLPEESRLAALKSAEAQMERQFSETATNDRDATAIPHELGHMWLIEAFWPGQGKIDGGHYGGPGPDWLDEMAAIVLEPDSSAERRRSLFAERYRKHLASGGGSDGGLLDLADYFTKAHPVGEQARALVGSAANEGGMQVRVLSGEEAQRFAGDGIRFYLQSRAVADYLLAEGRNPALLGEIAGHVAKGGTFASWLAKSGPRHGLVDELDRFSADWLAWLARRYPPRD